MFRLTTSAIASQLRCNQRVPFMSFLYRAKSEMPTEDGQGLGTDLTLGESKIIEKLKTGFPSATHIQVSDISGGCGAMYQISIEAPDFVGKNKLQQQKLVNALLAEEIKQMHGLQLNTKAPDSDSDKPT